MEEAGETHFVEINVCVEPTAQRAVAWKTAFQRGNEVWRRLANHKRSSDVRYKSVWTGGPPRLPAARLLLVGKPCCPRPPHMRELSLVIAPHFPP